MKRMNLLGMILSIVGAACFIVDIVILASANNFNVSIGNAAIFAFGAACWIGSAVCGEVAKALKELEERLSNK